MLSYLLSFQHFLVLFHKAKTNGCSTQQRNESLYYVHCGFSHSSQLMCHTVHQGFVIWSRQNTTVTPILHKKKSSIYNKYKLLENRNAFIYFQYDSVLKFHWHLYTARQCTVDWWIFGQYHSHGHLLWNLFSHFCRILQNHFLC